MKDRFFVCIVLKKLKMKLEKKLMDIETASTVVKFYERLLPSDAIYKCRKTALEPPQSTETILIGEYLEKYKEVLRNEYWQGNRE